jgi:hypothetical protein
MFAFLCQLFDIMAWSGVIGDVEGSGEAVETISDCNVEGFAKYAVPVRVVLVN